MYAVGDEYGFVTAFYRSYSARGAFTFLNGTESRRIVSPHAFLCTTRPSPVWHMETGQLIPKLVSWCMHT